MYPSTFLVALVDSGGTVPPELGAVRRLVARGHHVVVLAEDSTADEVRATGATLRRWETAPNRLDRSPEHDPARDWECRTPFELFDRLLDTQFVGPAAAYATDVTAAIADVRPDVVLCSQFAFGAMVAAEAAGVDFDVLMPNIYLLPTAGTTPVGMGLRPAAGPLGRQRDRLLNRLLLRTWGKGLPRLNEVRAQFGLPPLEHFFDQIRRARHEVLMTSEAFDFPVERPAHVRCVGPVLDDPSWAADVPLPAGDAPLVLVALSSTFQDQAACLQRIIDALATMPVRAVVTTGPALDPSTLRAPDHVTVVRSAAHTQLLEHASAIVTHGGHGTVLKALVAGVPLVVLPHGRDQSDNGLRVSARGAGIVVRRSAKPRSIERAVRAVLDDPAYRRAAADLGAQIARDAATDRLVEVLEASVPVAC